MKIKTFKLPLLLLLVVVGTMLFGDKLSLCVQELFYSISLLINALLAAFMPVLIFCLLFSSLVKMSGYFLWLVLLLFPAICLSNFITTMIAYVSGTVAISNMSALVTKVTSMTPDKHLTTLWSIHLPKLVSNQVAMALAVAFALLVLVISKSDKSGRVATIAQHVASFLNNLVTRILHHVFIPILPLFVFGFLLQLQYEGLLNLIVNKYGLVFATIVTTQFAYVLLLYGLATKFKFGAWLQCLKNMLPAWVVGFTTMSSAAAMPLTLNASISNTKDSQIPKLVIPATVNVHLIGDCIAIPIFALAIMSSLGSGLPSLADYLVFSGYFIIAKFAVAAVPAGGIIVMVPILEQHLGFSSEMSSLITMLYVLFDCVITSTNVLGNGAFAMLFNSVVVRGRKALCTNKI